MVTANLNLNAWNATTLGLGCADILIAALNKGSVTIEYCKYGGSPVAMVHTMWAKHNE